MRAYLFYTSGYSLALGPHNLHHGHCVLIPELCLGILGPDLATLSADGELLEASCLEESETATWSEAKQNIQLDIYTRIRIFVKFVNESNFFFLLNSYSDPCHIIMSEF